MFTYKAEIIKVVDGDTVDAIVDLGFRVSIKMRFRLAGIDTAELKSKDAELKVLANDAKKFMTDLLLNKTVIIETEKTDKYGRWLATIRLSPDAKSINEQLIEANLAKSYDGIGKTIERWT